MARRAYGNYSRLHENRYGYRPFFVPQVVVQGALDLVILVWTVVHGYKLVMWVLRKIPMLGIE